MSLDSFNACALVAELKLRLARARLQKLSQLTEYDFAIHFRSPGVTDKLLISLHPDRSRLHLLPEGHPPAIVPSSFVMLCRKHVGGTWLERVQQHDLDRVVEFSFSSGMSLVFDWAGKPSSLILLKSEERKIVGLVPSKGRISRREPYEPSKAELPTPLHRTSLEAWNDFSQLSPDTDIRDGLSQITSRWSPLWKRRFKKAVGRDRVGEVESRQFQDTWDWILSPLGQQSPSFRPAVAKDGELTYCADEAQFESMQHAANQRWLDSSLAPGVSDFRSDLIKKLKKSRDKACRKLDKRRKDKKGAESAPQDKLKGDLLLAYASGLKRGADKFQTQDWEGRPITIALDPKMSATENADRYYNRAKKKRRALVVLEEQIQKAEDEIEMWDELLFSAESSENRTDLEQVRKLMPNISLQKNRKKKKVPEVPSSGPRRFHHQDFLILVGRNPAQNDKLSLKTAAKDDHWFHVRQGAGSHVLIRCAGKEPPEQTKVAAAWLAAKHSQSAASPAVEVVTTRARFLKKPKGGPTGKVIYRQETEVVVDPTSPAPEGLSTPSKNGPAE